MSEIAGTPDRRDFMIVAAGAFAAVGAAAALWPAFDTMNPDAAEWALATTEVDLTPIKQGQAITVLWRRQPVFVRHRTPAEIEAAVAVATGELIDRNAENAALPDTAPASDQNRVVAGHEQWLVVIGICTHLGCIPGGQLGTDDRGQWGGWFCKCHGSQYDTAGRVRRGPAPRNLEVPKYYFVSDTRILIGNDKPDSGAVTS